MRVDEENLQIQHTRFRLDQFGHMMEKEGDRKSSEVDKKQHSGSGTIATMKKQKGNI